MPNKVQQIIKHRKGCIDKVKDINSYLSEIIYGVGNIGDVTGNVVFIGNKDSGSGNYSPIARIYFGTNAPTVNAYGSTMNGLPFYSVYDKTLYILNNPKNIDMDLSGNIYRRNIAPNNISASGYISGNSLDVTGNVKLGKNINNIIQINGKIQGDLIPQNSNTYDLGTPSNKWRNIYATLISGSFVGDGSALKNVNTSMSIQTIGSSTSDYNISLPNQKLTFYTDVTKGLNLAVGSNRVEIVPYNASYSQKGTSYYNPLDFVVDSGYVSINYTTLNSYTKTINTAKNQILVGDSSYSNTLLVNVLSDSTVNLKLEDNVQVSSSIRTNYIEGNTGYFTGSVYIGDFLQLMGNLYVSGTVTTIDSINVNIGDNIIGLNHAGAMADGGIWVYDSFGSSITGSLLWDATNHYWKAGFTGDEHRIVLQESSTLLTNKALVYANSSGRLISAVAPILNDIPIWDGSTWNNVNFSTFATTSSLGDYTASINAFTASIKTYTSSMNTWSGSIVNYTSSMNIWTGSLESYTSSINSFTSSIKDYTSSMNVWTGSVNSYIDYNNSFITSIKNYTSSMNDWTGSLMLYTSSINAFTASIKNYTSSMNLWTGSVMTYTSSMNLWTGSVEDRFATIGTLTGSYFTQNGNSFGTNAILGTNDNFSLHFETNNTTKMIVSSSGKVIIGSAIGFTPSALLNVNGDILSTGEVSGYDTSDSRLKDNIVKILKPYEILSKLNGYTFNWNDKQKLYKKGQRDIGLLAQEVEKVIPEIVGIRYDGYKSIKYERMIAILVEGFNEMREELEFLKNRG